jgi:hypothetical protein
MQKILINQVLSEVNKPNSVFSIDFRKEDGNISSKKGIVNRSLTFGRRKQNRSGILACMIPGTNQIFDVTIDLLVAFNGIKIIRPE